MVVGVAGLYLAGSHRAVGWAVGVAAQGLWLAYALVTRQYGFIVSSAAYAAVYTRNYLRWRAQELHR